MKYPVVFKVILVVGVIGSVVGCETNKKETVVKPEVTEQTKSVGAPSSNSNASSSSAPAYGANFIAVQDEQNKINGVGAVELRRVNYDKTQPHFTRATLLPGRGMNVFQLDAYIPGRGDVHVIDSLPLEEAQKELDVSDPYGNLSFKHGGAILVPFANRLRGQVSADKQKLSTTVAGHKLTLPANWIGKLPTAEPHTMHGLILNAKVPVDALVQTENEAAVEGTLHAGDFGVNWPSKTEVKFRAALQGNVFVLKVTTKNVGHETTPIGVGWHPYFAFPSGDRTQVKLSIPGSQRALVNNYDDVFPTGKSQPTKGSDYDFTAPGGRALGGQYLDDCFYDLGGKSGHDLVGLAQSKNSFPTAEIIDPAAGYHLKIRAMSPEIKAFQVFAPVDKAFAAIEPQFNLGDPYGKEWNHAATGMVNLKPGESVTYSVQLELL